MTRLAGRGRKALNGRRPIGRWVISHRALKAARTIADFGSSDKPGGPCRRGHAVSPRVSAKLKVLRRLAAGGGRVTHPGLYGRQEAGE
jgi:hypothetical protein